MVVQTLAHRVGLVTPDEFELIRTILELHRRREWIKEEEITTVFGDPPGKTQIYLEKLYSLKLIDRERQGNLSKYRLTFSGLDVIAIKSLFAGGIIKTLGAVIGQGKESSVYYGEDFQGNRVAVKLFRVNKKSFRNARTYNSLTYREDWMRVSLESARREYESLECVKKEGGIVPTPFGYRFNGVVMELLEGPLLKDYEAEEPEKMLDDILSTLRISYLYCGISHGDLSAYNIIVDDKRPVIFDWSLGKLGRSRVGLDVENILSFFRKKYGIERDLAEALAYVRGED